MDDERYGSELRDRMSAVVAEIHRLREAGFNVLNLECYGECSNADCKGYVIKGEKGFIRGRMIAEPTLLVSEGAKWPYGVIGEDGHERIEPREEDDDT